MTAPLKVLVVTDRYPPAAEGGAEISLHDTLQAMDPKQFDLRVLTFGDAEQAQTDILVDRMPDMMMWPRRSLGMPRNSKDVTGMLSAALMDFWERPSSAGLLGALALRKALRSRVPHPGSDSDMVATSALQRKKVRDVIEAFKPDIVHADNMKSILLVQSVPASALGRVAMVRDHRLFCSHPHQSMMVADRQCTQCQFGCVEGQAGGAVVRRAMMRNKSYRMQALRAYDEVVTTSRFLASFIGNTRHDRPVTAIANPHPDLDRISAAGRAAKPVIKSTILFSGNLRKEKGAVFFANVISELHDIDGLRVTFAGRGPEEDQLREIFQESDMADRVSYTGFVDRDELYRIMAETAVVVAPTLWPEPFGRLPLEAGLLGRPVVASAAGGHLETIIHGKTGLLFPAGDRDRFVAALHDLLRNPEKADALGRAAKAHVLKKFGPDTVSQRLGTVWHRAQNASRRSE